MIEIMTVPTMNKKTKKKKQHSNSSNSNIVYQIYRYGKPRISGELSDKYRSYEAARQAIRKWVRNKLTRQNYLNKYEGKNVCWDYVSRNPTNVISALGFKIKKKEQN